MALRPTHFGRHNLIEYSLHQEHTKLMPSDFATTPLAPFPSESALVALILKKTSVLQHP
jgi:hypothetical protein